jgi:tetratricopeptide (TPR) repeat protein
LILVVACAALGAGVWGFWRVRSAWLWSRARGAAEAKAWAEVDQTIQRLAWYGPLDERAASLGARAALARGDREAAAWYLGQVPRRSPGAMAARLSQGRLLLELYRLGAAEAAYREALSIDPRAHEARQPLIAILGIERRADDQEAELWAAYQAGDLARKVEALSFLAPAIAVIPPDTLARGVDEGVILERTVAEEPGNGPARVALAYFQRNRGRLDDARRLLEPWLRDHPDDLAAVVEWAAALLDEGRLDDAAPWLGLDGSTAPTHRTNQGRRAPRSVRARFALLQGAWLAARSENDKAVDATQSALELDPRNPEIHNRLGQLLRTVGRSGESAAQLQWVLHSQQLRQVSARIIPEQPDPALVAEAAHLCQAMGRRLEAEAWEDLNRRLNPAAARPSKAADSGEAPADEASPEARFADLVLIGRIRPR